VGNALSPRHRNYSRGHALLAHANQALHLSGSGVTGVAGSAAASAMAGAVKEAGKDEGVYRSSRR